MATQFSQKTIKTSLLLVPVSLVLTTVAALAQAPTPVTPVAPVVPVTAYSSDTTQKFVQVCVGGIIDRSPTVPVTLVSSYCQCIIGKVQTQLPESDFIALDKALADPKTSKSLDANQQRSNAILNQAGQTCAAQARPSASP